MRLLGHKRVTDVGPGEIERFVRDVAVGKTARDEKTAPRTRIIVRGGEGAARKVVEDSPRFVASQARRDLVARNPCELAAVRKTDNRRDRFLTLEEVARLGRAFDELEAKAPT